MDFGRQPDSDRCGPDRGLSRNIEHSPGS